VTFKDGATALGTATLSSGQATYATSALSGGPHSITAVYSGDASFADSTSPALTQTVTTIQYGQQVTGHIDFANDYEDWWFTGTAGDIITVQMVQDGGASLWTSVSLYDPSGTKIATGWDQEHPEAALIGNYGLAFSGTYVLRASGWGSGPTGGYKMSLNLESA
jgi:hypothetical protein